MYVTFVRVLHYLSLLGLILFAGCAADPGWRGHDPDHGRDRGESKGLSCASYENAYRRCEVDGRLLKVRLRERLSVSECEYGRSWGWSRHSVWVDKGCRADFDILVDD
ncbi:hypothetical protein GCM10009552_11570 [Rothia nasimurium]|uniref:DUF3011 domain-containing protein n=1 Tax=Luteibacter anthropi TaxID=564369 RepID=A0A7X5U777_9GAMM|nr:DUF3011 domain-containing protein [Luteibacter anthropi]NII05124.1 DUF3011 domain-containing protein [Luteibacter anthropi]